MRWSWGCCHFLSFVFSVDACFVFDFVVFYLWVNSDNITHWQSGWFQIPYLGLCPPSIDWKISLISLAKCLASLIWEPIFFQIYTDLSKFGFTLIVVVFSQKSMQILFTDRAVLYMTVRLMDKILGKVSPWSYCPKISVAYGDSAFISLSRLCPSLTGLNGWDDTEFTSRSSFEWHGIHQWGITCLIDVVILRMVMQRCG